MKYVLNKFKYIIAVLLTCIVLNGCSTPVRTEPVIQQEILLVECTKDTPIPEGLDGKSLYETLLKWQSTYNECSTTHDKLIKTIRELRDVKKI